MAPDVEDILSDLIDRVGKVRRWLLTLGVLKTAAVWLGCICLYVGLYALVDHRVHFGWPGRLSALLLLVGLLVALSYYLIKTLRRDMTYSHAASHVENRQSFDQQLVAAVEFYEGRLDYPYSRSLARQLVLQVDRASRGFAFDSTVDKWRGYLLAGCIILCVSIVGLFVRQNVLYFSSYLARLVRPFSHIEPVPTTVLQSITGDIITGPNVPVTLTAAIQGRLPDSATLVLTRPNPDPPNDTASEEPERIEIRPKADGREGAALTATRSFDALGGLTYRFEAGDVRSDSHTITVTEPPAIESVTAMVSLPNEDDRATAQMRTEKITDQRLEVLPHSRVNLQIRTTVPVREATVTGMDGEPTVRTLDDAETFGLQFTADRTSSLEFNLVSAEGLSNSEPLKLHIHLKSDEPPQFKLLSPDGDYLATNVASIPITVEITDDFGLDSAQLCCEPPNGEPIVLDANEPQGSKRAHLSHTLELERYDLEVGDSVLFYAKATDIDTGQSKADANCFSEIYFIEIRPYRQYWHPQPGGGPSSAPGPPPPDDLISILEYTRAILKKTWAAAQTPAPTDVKQATLEGLCADVEYCAGQLAAIRDDSDYGFGDADKSALSGIIELYEEAGAHLTRHDAKAALPPERQAYRLLRKFVDELHLKWNPPQSGPSAPEEKPERVKLQEQPEVSQADAERAESQLEKLQQKVEKLSREQKSLKKDLARTLQQQGQAASDAQSSDATSSSSGGGGQPSSSGSENQQPRDEKDSQSRGPSADASREARRDTPDQQSPSQADASSGQAQDGAAQPGGTADQGKSSQADASPGQAQDGAAPRGAGADQSTKEKDQAQTTSNSGSQSQGSDSGQAGKGSAASKGEGSQGRGSSGPGQSGTSPGRSTTPGQGRGADGRSSADSEAGSESSRADTDARLRMLEARQKALRQQASDVSEDLGQLALPDYATQADAQNEAKQRIDRAIEDMKQFEDKLADRRYDAVTSPTGESQMADLADSAAMELAEAGRAIGRGLSGGKQADADKAQTLAEQLAEDAEALDESVSPEERERMLERLEAAERLLESMAGAQWTTINGSSAPGTSHVYTRSARASPGEAARMLSRQLWSVAIQARDRQIRPVEDEPSDVQFFELENEFFESAARYKPQRRQK